MDQKHREYCIKLGNPYMMNENDNYQRNERRKNSFEGFEIEVEDNDENWLKNTKKFTN